MKKLIILVFLCIFLTSGCTSKVTIGNQDSELRDPYIPDYDPRNIGGYDDLVTTCQQLGTEMGTIDMVINAGVEYYSGNEEVSTRANSENLSELTNPDDYPILLDQADTEYILTDDITNVPVTAFEVRASQITLNLNGHEVIYGNATAPIEYILPDTNEDPYGASFGVRVTAQFLEDIKVINGKITQGQGECEGHMAGYGCNPLFFALTPPHIVFAGLDITLHAKYSSGIYAHWQKNIEIRHNTITDALQRFDESGMIVETGVKNRHHINAQINMQRGHSQHVHHNKIINARQAGIWIGSNSEVNHNEVFIDSTVTNSMGITTTENSTVHHNKVFGYGAMPIGIWPGDYTQIYSNYVHVEKDKNLFDGNSHHGCMRMTWGNWDPEIMCNHLDFKSGNPVPGTDDYSRGFAIWAGLGHPDNGGQDQRATISHNFIMSKNIDGISKAGGIAIVSNYAPSDLIFIENVVVSNYANIILADDYGPANAYAAFYGNHLVKYEDNPTYMTLKSNYSVRPSTGLFYDTTFSGGASFEEENVSLDLSADVEAGGYKHVGFGRYNDGNPIIDYYITNVEARRDEGVSFESFDEGWKVFMIE